MATASGTSSSLLLLTGPKLVARDTRSGMLGRPKVFPLSGYRGRDAIVPDRETPTSIPLCGSELLDCSGETFDLAAGGFLGEERKFKGLILA